MDFRPISPPYEVTAVGPPTTCAARFVDGFGGSYLQVLRDYGIDYAVTDEDELSLPASAGVTHALRRQPQAAAAGLGTRQLGQRAEQGGHTVIAALGLVLGIVAGLFLEPTVPDLAAALPADRRRRRARRGVRRAARAARRHLRRPGVRRLVRRQRLVAALIVYLGDQLGVGSQLSTGVVVVLGIRIFSNAAAIRRHLFRA